MRARHIVVALASLIGIIGVTVFLVSSSDGPGPPRDTPNADRPASLESERVQRIRARVAEDAAEREQRIAGQPIVNPSGGEPEWTLLQLLLAAADADAERGFTRATALTHTSLTSDTRRLGTLRQYNFPALRRKAPTFLEDAEGSPSYRLMAKRDDPDGSVRLFVKTTSSDMPTPFRLSRDEAAAGQWRLLSF